MDVDVNQLQRQDVSSLLAAVSKVQRAGPECWTPHRIAVHRARAEEIDGESQPVLGRDRYTRPQTAPDNPTSSGHHNLCRGARRLHVPVHPRGCHHSHLDGCARCESSRRESVDAWGTGHTHAIHNPLICPRDWSTRRELQLWPPQSWPRPQGTTTSWAQSRSRSWAL